MPLRLIWLSFQFHKGAIRTRMPASLEGSQADFNSIKVRLELPGSLGILAAPLDFNSIKVRLEPEYAGPHE